MFFGIEDKTVSDRAVVEKENQGRNPQKALAQTVERDDFPCVGEELSRVKLVKMVLQEKIVTASTGTNERIRKKIHPQDTFDSN